jgi:hypothetical protein
VGTRNLTAVILDGDFRIAQYGQWDGYPTGEGATVLEFLSSFDRTTFERKLRAASFLTDEEIEAINADPLWKEKYPHLSRDAGAEILSMVFNGPDGIKLLDKRDFAGDSLFCEWAYIIDLDAEQLEVYKGFNHSPLDSSERFAHLPSYTTEHGERNTYYPIRKIKSYPLNELPSVEKMDAECSPQEEGEV